MARPTKLTSEAEQLILKALRAGNYRATAARLAGIHPATFHRWIERGDPNGTNRIDQPYRDFAAKVDKAIAEAEAREVTQISRAAEQDWRAAAWRLSRRHPERWAASAPPRSTAGRTGVGARQNPQSTIGGLQDIPDPDLEHIARVLGIDKPIADRPPAEPPVLQLTQAVWDELYERRLGGSRDHRNWAHDLLEHLAGGGDRDDCDLETRRDELAAQHGLPPRPR